MPLDEVIMETQRVGNALRVYAIDAETGVEVVFQTPLSAPKSEIKKLAINKLKYVLKKASLEKK